MSETSLLQAARAIVAASWTKGACARDDSGSALSDFDAPGAVRWCISGALDYAGRDFSERERDRARLLVWDAIGGVAEVGAVARFNDSVEHADVLAMFDRAIERDLGTRNRMKTPCLQCFDLVENHEGGKCPGRPENIRLWVSS